MRPAVVKFGEEIRRLREALGLTQQELADRTEPKVSRSAVAHLEQGLRLPRPAILDAICSRVGIEKERWFLLESSERATSIGRISAIGMVPRFVAISGIQGSGKSTLASAMAKVLRATALPEKSGRIGTGYLRDFQINKERWAFETQMAFLLSNFLQIQQKLHAGHRIVIDRSLEEDCEIFAKLFKDKGYIESRAYEIYDSLSAYALGSIPRPDLYILCYCSPDEAHSRICKRNRDDSGLHTLEHIRELAARYEEYFSRIETDGAIIYRVDTESTDLRDSESLRQVIRNAVRFWQTKNAMTEQLSLTEMSSANSAESGNINGLMDVRYVFPTVYIAAPFTAMARSEPEESQQLSLFHEEALHGRIGKGKYRDVLNRIDRALTMLNLSTILPHRDVNKWGDISVSPPNVVSGCTAHVLECDLFVGILANSSGSHYEFGIAMGMKKPSIIIHCAEVLESYISKGTVSLPSYVLNLYCERLRDIPALIGLPETRKFISTQLGIQFSEIRSNDSPGFNDK